MVRGAQYFPGYLDADAQAQLVSDLAGIIRAAPFFTPITSRGQPMSVRMSAAGAFGWISDRSGYRYDAHHPTTGNRWPQIPPSILTIWKEVAGDARAPECCLINHYSDAARMGMHQDADEADFSQPVVSVSLGDDALFRIGNATRGGKTDSVWLRSGDVLVMGGAARRLFHGVDRIKPGTSTLLPKGGRINLTLRVVT